MGKITTKKCSKCGEVKSEFLFSIKSDRGIRNNQCRMCEYSARDARRKANLHKDNAKSKANQAVKAGLLVNPLWCEECDEYKPLQKHHDDYDKPLEVKWLCQKCHSRLHVDKRKKIKV